MTQRRDRQTILESRGPLRRRRGRGSVSGLAGVGFFPPRPRPAWVEFAHDYDQGYRVADASLDRYELYVGIDEEPDFTAPPATTSTTLPFSYSPSLPSSGNATVYVVVRKRDAYDLQSFNVWSKKLVFESHIATLGPIAAPRELAVYDRASGALLIIAKYFSIDDDHPADTWELYAKVGVDPVPGTDTPVYSGAMAFLGIESGVSYLSSGWTPGTTVHVIATARRSADGKRASSAAVLHLVAPALDLTDGFGFGGHAFEQQAPE